MTPTTPIGDTRRETVDRLRAAGCVFAEDEARLLHDAAPDPDRLAALVERRAAGEPLEHLLGWAEFAGLRIVVEPGVFVPRRRTELVVREAISGAPKHAVVVDLCCGSGAVGAALSSALDVAELYAVDVDPVAVRCARRNLDDRARVYEGDLDAPLPERLRGRVDVLVANAPYVPTEGLALMPPEARHHEPRTALDGGPDGLDTLRRVCAVAPRWLAPGGRVLVETSTEQAPRLAAWIERQGMRSRVTHAEELAATVVVGTMPGERRR
jgi:release factor glutamine methyltransferase